MSFEDSNDATIWTLGDFRLVTPELWLSLAERLPVLKGEAHEKLEKLKRIGNIDKFIVELVPSYLRSVEALNRYRLGLNEVYEASPDCICIALLLAECHHLMYDTAGAFRLLNRVKYLLQQEEIDDPDLVLAIKHIGALKRYEETGGCEEDDGGDDDSIKCYEYSRPSPYDSSSAPSNLATLVIKWSELQKKGDGAEQFVRFAAVTSNEIEGVFSLSGDSTMQLARRGLCIAAVAKISSHSRHKSREKILEIIRNTERCHHSLKYVANQTEIFDETFLKSLHRKILDGDNTDLKYDEEFERSNAYITGMGVYREVPCFTLNEGEGPTSQTNFCPAPMILEEMNYFFQQAKIVLDSGDQDPYHAAAYLHYLFVRIHPFGDGNGRIARLIASIPLLRVGLPPVIVRNTKPYFKLLQELDKDGDIGNFANFLQAESFKAIEDLLDYDPKEYAPRVMKPDDLLEGLRRLKNEQELACSSGETSSTASTQRSK